MLQLAAAAVVAVDAQEAAVVLVPRVTVIAGLASRMNDPTLYLDTI